MGAAAFAAFLSTIPAANWLIGNVGTVCVLDGPCLLPVGFGLSTPSGVLVAGLALVLRDIVQQSLGRWWALSAVFIGAGLSALFAPPALVIASSVAFLLSELADFAVYTPLRRRGFAIAVVASSLVGLVIDSTAFLFIAFGSLDYLMGQIVGKTWMVLAVVVIIQVTAQFRTKGRAA